MSNNSLRFNTSKPSVGHRRLFGLVTLAAFSASCYRPPAPPATGLPRAIDSAQLEKKLDETIQSTFEKRHLSSTLHGAWQVLHGVLAYGRSFEIRDAKGQLVPAVDYLLGGGQVDGWEFVPGEQLGSGRRGLRATLQPGTTRGQGHADQWLAVLAQADLPEETPIRVSVGEFLMSDYLAQVQRDVPRNVEREWSWTLIALTKYLKTNAEWTASDGQTWTIPRLVQSEVEQDLASSACGGTHRLIGLTMALDQHRRNGGAIEGPWSQAEQLIQASIENARMYQNPDGSFSTNYFQRPGTTPDLAQALGTTGHVLEFLTLSLTTEQLREPWVQRAVLNLCDLFRKTESVSLECGALYHAMHGLVLYRDRVFGPLDPEIDGGG